MNNDALMPNSVQEAFPLLSHAKFITRLAAPVPIVPDTTFDLYKNTNEHLFTLVTTDYADPLDQSKELIKISGQYEFINLVKPHHNNEMIKIREHDNMDGTFLIKHGNIYYYLASTRSIQVRT